MKKKIISITIIVLVLGGIFGLSIQQKKNDSPVIGSVVDVIMPAVAYADSDTVGDKFPPPPPPPIF